MMKTRTVIPTIFALIACAFIFKVHAQDTKSQKAYRIIRSSLGSGGSSKVFSASNGEYKVSQSIGQTSVIGTYANKGYYLRQGYQQPSGKIKVVKTSEDNNLFVKVFPNPFEEKVEIAFSETTEQAITVSVYDIGGKRIYFKEFLPSHRLALDLKHLPSGSYVLSALSSGKLFNVKLLKL